MTRVLHLIDRDTPADMLATLALLAGENEEIVSVGAPPDFPADRPVGEIHEPLSSAVAAGMRLRLRAENVSVIHSWSPRSQRAGAVAARAGKVRQVRSLPSVPAGGKGLARLVRSLSGKNPISVTVPTVAARSRLARAGIEISRIALLPPPAALNEQPSRRAQLREQFGIPAGAFVMVAPDAMIRPANLTHASWAHAIMAYVLDEPSWLIMPIGGPMERAVLAFADGAGFIERTIGPFPAGQLGDALAAADVAVFFRTDDCGSTAVTAAMAAGLPIVAYDTPDVVECAGDAALLAAARTPRAAGQALLQIVEQPDLADQLRVAAGQRTTQFTPAICRAALDNIYAALTARSPECACEANA